MLFSAIDAEYPEFDKELPPLELSAVQHELMARARREGFVARSKDLKAVEDYVLQPSAEAKGLLITGQAGVGKSALLAKAAEKLAEHKDVEVISFFVGTNPESFDLLEMLIFLVHQLDKVRHADELCVCMYTCVCIICLPENFSSGPSVVCSSCMHSHPLHSLL